MKDWSPNELRKHALPLGATVASAVIVFMVASQIATSTDLRDREARLQARLDQLELRLSALGPGSGQAYLLCTQEGPAAQARLESRLEAAAESADLEWTHIQVASEPSEAVETVTFSVSGEGPYSAIIAALERLTQSGPTLFVDELSIRESAIGVALELEGRQLCSTPRA